DGVALPCSGTRGIGHVEIALEARPLLCKGNSVQADLIELRRRPGLRLLQRVQPRPGRPGLEHPTEFPEPLQLVGVGPDDRMAVLTPAHSEIPGPEPPVDPIAGHAQAPGQARRPEFVWPQTRLAAVALAAGETQAGRQL